MQYPAVSGTPFSQERYTVDFEATPSSTNTPFAWAYSFTDEKPLSIIGAVDPFGLQYLTSQEMKRKDIKRLHVNQGKMVMFTNMCLQSGDTNKSDENRLRLFAYQVSNVEDFPKNEVMLYVWTENIEDTQIKSAALPNQKERIRRINESNVYGQKSVLCSHPPKRVRYQTEKYGFFVVIE